MHGCIKFWCCAQVALIISISVIAVAFTLNTEGLLDGSGPHLVVLVHGVGSWARQTTHIAEAIKGESTKYTIFSGASNQFGWGFVRSIEIQAQRLLDEIESVRLTHRKNVTFQRVSVVGMSLGGVVGIRMLKLMDSHPYWKHVSKRNLFTLASPLLGIKPDVEFSWFDIRWIRYYLSYLTYLQPELDNTNYGEMASKLRITQKIAFVTTGTDLAVPNYSSSLGGSREQRFRWDFQLVEVDLDFKVEIKIGSVHIKIPLSMFNHGALMNEPAAIGYIRQNFLD